jgi:hypothetical protein
LSRVRAEVARIDLAIRNYHARFGFYPPDNVIDPNRLQQDPVVNQLYYELSGAVLLDLPGLGLGYRVSGDTVDNAITRAGYIAGFGNGNLAGIYNSSASEANIKNFLASGRPVETRIIALDNYISGAFAYQALVVPVEWPLDHWKTQLDPTDEEYDARFFPPLLSYVSNPAASRETLRLNPLRYNMTNPTNNPGEFDLWADIVVGNEFVTIGNWKDE